ncbi:AraC family transcriptional regulator [Paenibacillus sp. FSL H8-0548]|uniref:helix-turn-helix domain-containing protein n=1 Tax=Paenibacillus sp. FSL H8-0548 TaxID=1920422 RepID=UPI00096D47F7|nr:helix-turn-helix domain-containing protein [Paenibacillus sp. FSL H8-0548]OMF30048.1 AraC family transcriptional regulator [Paenibacillus sp. FSL H8-0548]
MNFNDLWKKRKSIIFTWLLSYSAVLFVPMIISLIVYSQSSDTLKSEIHRANDSMLRQVKYTIDTQIDLMKRLNMEITWNSKLQNLMYSTISAGEAQFTAYQLVKEFRMYQTSYASIDEFYVTWNQESAVLRSGNVRDMETAFKTIHDTGTMSYEQWLDQIRHSKNNRFLLLPHLDSVKPQTGIAYLTHLPKDLNGEETGTVVVMADIGRFQQAIESISGFSGGQVLILNEDNQVLLSNLPVSINQESLLQRFKDGSQVMYTPTRDGDSELFYIHSAVSELKYVLVIPSRIYWEKAEYVRKFTYMSILISLIGAGVLTWFFMRRNYSPIQQLVQSLSDKNVYGERTDWNELSFIQRAISNTRSEKEKISLQFEAHQQVLRSNMLNRLLKGKMDTLIPYEEAFTSFNMKLLSEQFAVILFVVENDSSLSVKLPGMDTNERSKLIQFIITNVVEELVGHYHHAGYVAEVDDMMVCLVNFGAADSAGFKEELHAIATEAQRFLLRFQMDLTVSIGGIHASLPGIAEAYREAVDAMAYKMVLGKQEIITYDEIRRDTEDNLQFGYYYPLQVEQQIINLIKVGDFEQASKFMEDVTDRNFNKPIMSLTLARCLIFNLAGTMVKAINELGDGDNSILGDNPLWLDKIIACDTILEMKQELQTLLKEVCAFAAAKLENNVSHERAESLRDLVTKVTCYIEEQYSDPNLSVNTLGEHFELKGSYLSKLFKNQTGEGLLDFISKYRIEQAKRMIKRKQHSISDVAKQVGYNEVATFIRVFKKYEGITPGKFKEMD